MKTVGLCDCMHATDEDWLGAFRAACAGLGLESRLVSIRRSDWPKQTDDLDAFIWRPHMGEPSTMAEIRTKLPLLEARGIRCFPNSLMLWLYDDKIRETFFLQQHGYPMPETFVTFDPDEARLYAQNASYPLVTKTHMGAAASGVMLVRSPGEAERLLDRIFTPQSVWDKARVKFYFNPRLAKGSLLAARQFWFRDVCPRYAYFQEFIPSDGDWRITTFGADLVSCFVRRNRSQDFRASGSGKFQKLDTSELPLEACDMALEISERHGFTSMAYDFFHGPSGWLIGEISYTFALNPIYTETLFRRACGAYHKVDPIPICEMHLQAMLGQPERCAGISTVQLS